MASMTKTHEQAIGKRTIVRKGTGKPKLDVQTAFGKASGGFQKTGARKVGSK